MKRGQLFVMVIFVLALWVWLKGNTKPSGVLAVENTMSRLYDQVCPPNSRDMGYSGKEQLLSFSCAQSAGHINSVSFYLFDDLRAARAAFEEWRQDHPAVDFRGYPSVVYENKDFMLPGGLQRVMVWRIRRMLFVITAFDDTGYHIARDPYNIAESLYIIGQEELMVRP